MGFCGIVIINANAKLRKHYRSFWKWWQIRYVYISVWYIIIYFFTIVYTLNFFTNGDLFLYFFIAYINS